MTMFHLLKIRTSIDILKMKSVKLLLALSILRGEKDRLLPNTVEK